MQDYDRDEGIVFLGATLTSYQFVPIISQKKVIAFLKKYKAIGLDALNIK